MTEDEFLEKYQYVPIDFMELLEIASKVEGEVGDYASEAMKAIDDFEGVLNRIGFEWG